MVMMRKNEDLNDDEDNVADEHDNDNNIDNIDDDDNNDGVDPYFYNNNGYKGS